MSEPSDRFTEQVGAMQEDLATTKRLMVDLSNSIFETWALPKAPRLRRRWLAVWLALAAGAVWLAVLTAGIYGPWRAGRVADSWTWTNPDSQTTYRCTAVDPTAYRCERDR